MERMQLDEFVDRISPFYGLWQSVRVSGAAVNLNGGWFNVALQLEMREEKPEARTSFLVPPDFLHFRFEYPLSDLRNLILETIQNGFFSLGADGNAEAKNRIFLSRNASNSAEAAARMAWFGPRFVQPANTASGPASRAWVNLTARGDRLDELITHSVLERIDSALRLEDPSYDGILDLFRQTLPHAPTSLDGQSYFDLRADLPFELEVDRGGAITVRSSSLVRDRSLRVIFYFGGRRELGSTRHVLAFSDSRVLENSSREWTVTPDWPGDAERAKVVLFFETNEVRSAELSRWKGTANLRVVVDRYFDTEHKHLRELLLSREKMKGKVSPFELGVGRLLHMLGLPVALYSDGAEEARPDAGGYFEDERVAILVEATLENPAEKFSKMAERVHQLRGLLPKDCEVLGLIFTRAATSAAERRQALDHGLVLIGHSEILELLEMIATRTNARLAFEYFQGVMSKAGLESRGLGD
jgi:hypothetical protein